MFVCVCVLSLFCKSVQMFLGSQQSGEDSFEVDHEMVEIVKAQAHKTAESMVMGDRTMGSIGMCEVLVQLAMGVGTGERL